MIEDST